MVAVMAGPCPTFENGRGEFKTIFYSVFYFIKYNLFISTKADLGFIVGDVGGKVNALLYTPK